MVISLNIIELKYSSLLFTHFHTLCKVDNLAALEVHCINDYLHLVYYRLLDLVMRTMMTMIIRVKRIQF